MSHRIREQTVVSLREFERKIDRHTQRARELLRELNQVVSQASLKALFLFDDTRREVLGRIDALMSKELFLSGTKASDRITVDSHFLSREQYAAKIINSLPKLPSNEGASVIAQALNRVRDLQRKSETQLAAFEDSRQNILHVFRQLIRHIRDSRRLRLHQSGSSAENLEFVARYVLEDGVFLGGRQDSQKKLTEEKAVALLKDQGVRKAIQKLSDDYLSTLYVNRSHVLQLNKTEVLKATARKQIDEFETKCRAKKRNRLPRLQRAITALHFAFAAEQHLDLGKMDSKQRKRFEQVVSEATPKGLEEAVRGILANEVLTGENFSLFRYHPVIYPAFLDVSE